MLVIGGIFVYIDKKATKKEKRKNRTVFVYAFLIIFLVVQLSCVASYLSCSVQSADDIILTSSEEVQSQEIQSQQEKTESVASTESSSQTPQKKNKKETKKSTTTKKVKKIKVSKLKTKNKKVISAVKEASTLNRKVYFISKLPLRNCLQRYTYRLCRKNKVSYELVLALMYYESRYRTKTVSYNTNGSYDSGLMQVNSCNLSSLKRKYGITDLTNPYENIYAGVKLISEKVNVLGENDGLMAYNLGLGGYYQAIKKGIFNTAYSRKILAKKTEIENMPHGK